MSKPICKITNGAFSYTLEVDGINITISDPDYFIEHYKKLGYEVIYDDGYWSGAVDYYHKGVPY